jgi:hypothetical protein
LLRASCGRAQGYMKFGEGKARVLGSWPGLGDSIVRLRALLPPTALGPLCDSAVTSGERTFAPSGRPLLRFAACVAAYSKSGTGSARGNWIRTLLWEDRRSNSHDPRLRARRAARTAIHSSNTNCTLRPRTGLSHCTAGIPSSWPNPWPGHERPCSAYLHTAFRSAHRCCASNARSRRTPCRLRPAVPSSEYSFSLFPQGKPSCYALLRAEAAIRPGGSPPSSRFRSFAGIPLVVQRRSCFELDLGRLA